MGLPTSIRQALVGVMTVAFTVASCQLATPAKADDKPAPPATTVAVATDIGASEDVAAISDAAEDFEAGNPATVADLADAASAADEVPLKKTKGGFEVANDDGAEITVTKDGATTLSAPGVPEIGISVAGDADASKLVDGVLVQTEVAPSTDVVTRATDNGVQLIAVLADADAPDEIEFPLELPRGGELVELADGALAVMAPVTRVLADPGEWERVNREVESILGANYDVSVDPTPAQEKALASIPPVSTHEEGTVEQVAVVHAPWAVDANGRAVDTHYRVDGNTLIQVVDAGDDAAFPITLDPGVDWWKVTKCVAAIAWAVGSTIFAVAKIAKIRKYIEALGGITQTAKLVMGATTKAEKAIAIGKGLLTFAAIVFGIDQIYENCRP